VRRRSLAISRKHDGFFDLRLIDAERRFTFIDGLRGLACLGVFAFHLYTLGSFHGVLLRYVPSPVEFLIAHGNLGVQIFFVLSGFVIAYSLRNARINAAYLGNFALRRALRLDPAYWVAMAIAIFLCATKLGKDVPGQYVPTFKQVLINLFYLQEFAQTHRILSVSWTLCYEVQFYLVLTILIGFGQSLAAKCGWSESGMILGISFTVGLISVLIAAEIIPNTISGLFINLWFMFYLGCLVAWRLEGRISIVWIFLYAAAVALTLLRGWNWDTAMALATAGVILAVGLAQKLTSWLDNSIIQFFGRTSYSIYLLHALSCEYVLAAGRRITGDSPLPAAGWIGLAFALTVGASFLLYRFVERPGVELGKRLKEHSRQSRNLIQTSTAVDPLAICVNEDRSG
jgi:peptidoglycan/LPS O-acetylase OafA/YrhL